MAANQTQNYALNQWKLSDSVVMADFNADNQKVDAALTTLNSRIDTAVADAQQQLNTVAEQIRATIPHVQTGTYVGTGTSGEAHPNTLTFDFKPMYVAIVTEDGLPSRDLSGTPRIFIRPWKFTSNCGIAGNYDSSVYTFVTWLDNGLAWYSQYGNGTPHSPAFQFNESGVTYHYIAIG